MEDVVQEQVLFLNEDSHRIKSGEGQKWAFSRV